MNLDEPIEYTPSAIERVDDSGIRIHWSDGETTLWSAQQLRDACPCATCREKRGKLHGDASSEATAKPLRAKLMSLPVLSAAEARPTRIDAMQPVGTYAYNIAFSDGHHSGLFTFARLRRDEG